MAARWRRQKRATGLAGVCQGTRGFELWDGNECLAHVAVTNRDRYADGPWYWYGFGQNTCGSPVPTAKEAKAQAMACYKQQRVGGEKQNG